MAPELGQFTRSSSFGSVGTCCTFGSFVFPRPRPFCFYDFLPTACELAGAEVPKEIDGISYLPTLLGQDERQRKHEYLYCASSEGATSVGVRYGKWKLVRYRTKDQTADWRLYDLVVQIASDASDQTGFLKSSAKEQRHGE